MPKHVQPSGDAGTGSPVVRSVSQPKLPYRIPMLTVFGSVRELTGTMSGIGPGDGATMMNSDPAMKENVVRVGTHPAGFGIYLFDYKAEWRDTCGHGRRFGVLADEVEQVVPDAVAMDAAGYRTVNYSMIGVVCH